MENPNQKYQRCHGDGEAYKTYIELEPKFTDEFISITMQILVENYLRLEMTATRHLLLPDRDYVRIKNTWRSIAEELKVLDKYPYNMDEFTHAHPLAHEAVLRSQDILNLWSK